MSLALREVISQPRVFERGTGKDAFFGEQIAEQFTAEGACPVGDRTISCVDVTRSEPYTYTAIGNCIPGTSRTGLFQCSGTRQVPTGQQKCQCERAVVPSPTPSLDIEGIFSLIGAQRPITPESFPIGTAGTAVQPVTGRSPVAVLLILAVLGVAGYFIYQRYRKRG